MQLKHLMLSCSLLWAVTHAQAGSPRLARIVPPGGQVGTTVEVYLTGRYLDRPQEVLLYDSGIVAESIEPLEGEVLINGRKERVEAGTRVRVQLKLTDDCRLGPHGLRLRTAGGLTEYQRFFVGPFPSIDEDEQNNKRNDKREAAKEVPVNSTVLGRMNDGADVDLYRIEAQQGDRISAEIEAARIGVERGLPDLHLAILNADGTRLIEADDSALYLQDPVASVLAERAGTYFVQVRHNMYNAAGETYRLHVGNFPRPTALYPAGGEAGSQLVMKVLGDPQGAWSTQVSLPSEQAGDYPFTVIDSRSGVSAPSPNTLRITPFANVLETEPNDSSAASEKTDWAELPIAFNGIIDKPGDVDCFHFHAKKGERYRIHVLANALGSPVDPTVWVKPVSGKPGAPLKATDARANQLGLPPSNGLFRMTLDPVLEFNVLADGEYVLGVEDDRGAGGADYVYRVECQPDKDGIFTYIPPEPENRFTPQLRQTVAVAAGNRYNTQVAIVTTDRPYDGELELVAVGLPKGLTMTAPRMPPGTTRVPVVFEAAGDAKPQAAFVDLLVRPVGEAKAPFDSGYRQVVTMNMYGNQDFYLHAVLEKLLVAVTEPAPFSIEVDEPGLALVQNGETAVGFKVRRAKGFEGAVTVTMEWRPGGITGSTPITIPAEKDAGVYLLGASKNATAGTYPVTLTASSGGARSYYDTSDRSYVASPPFKLTVSEPHLEGRFARTSIERGKTVELVCKLNHLKPFTGTAKATLARLPRGVELVEPMHEIKADDKQVVFVLKATEDALLGNYQGVALDVTVVEDDQPLRQISGNGMLRVDSQRGPAANTK